MIEKKFGDFLDIDFVRAKVHDEDALEAKAKDEGMD